MLRYLLVLFALVLLLGGCTQDTTQPPAPTENTPIVTPQNIGIYMPDSAMEQATAGAVRVFRLGSGDYYDCVMLGNQLLMMRKEGDDGVLTLYSGDKLEPVREIRLIGSAPPGADALQINEQGFGYFDEAVRAVIFFNSELQNIGQVALPDEAQGMVWLTPDWKNAYYCTDLGIYVMDLQTGIFRLLREQTAVSQEITGGFGAGEVIRCEMVPDNGEKQVLLIDTKTGAQLQKGDHLANLVTRDEQYFLPCHDRGVELLRFGSGESHQVLWPAEAAQSRMLFSNNAMVMVEKTRERTTLSYYCLESGLRKAAITLEGISQVWGIQGDGNGGVWLYAGNATGGRWLYHWNCEKSLTGDETIYIAPFYTAQEPDAEGLAQLKEKAKELGDKIGIDILLWDAAAELDPEGYTFTA